MCVREKRKAEHGVGEEEEINGSNLSSDKNVVFIAKQGSHSLCVTVLDSSMMTVKSTYFASNVLHCRETPQVYSSN